MFVKALFVLPYLGTVRPCVTPPLSLRWHSSLSRVRRISLSTALSGSSRPESSEPGDRVEDRVEDSVGSMAAAGWISL